MKGFPFGPGMHSKLADDDDQKPLARYVQQIPGMIVST